MGANESASYRFTWQQRWQRRQFALPWIMGKANALSKRALDIFASSVGLLVLSPFFLLIGFLVRRDHAGSVFFRGRRVGKDGKEFCILKFRTMSDAAESDAGPKITAQDDPRVTPLGRWLRDTKINEFPQLWNVLKGEMSLVGPRPEDPEIVATWAEDVRREVLSVRPGITSPASVLYRNEESLMTTARVMQTYLESILPSKLRLDQLYVRHHSFILDLDVLFWTALVLLPRLGSYAPPEELLYLGPLRRIVQRYLNWFVVDTIVTWVAIGLAGTFLRSLGPLDVGFPRAVGIAFGFSFLFSVTCAVLGMYRIAWTYASSADAFGLFLASTVACLFAILINQNSGDLIALPLNVILLASVLAFCGFVIVRYRSRLISGLAAQWLQGREGAQVVKERVLIVGGGYTGQFIAWLLSNGPNADAFRVLGFIDDDLYKQGIRFNGVSVLGRRADIPRLVERHDVGLIFFAIHNITSADRSNLLEICAGTPARVIKFPDILGALNGIIASDARSEIDGAAANSEMQMGNLEFCDLCLIREQLRMNGRLAPQTGKRNE